MACEPRPLPEVAAGWSLPAIRERASAARLVLALWLGTTLALAAVSAAMWLAGIPGWDEAAHLYKADVLADARVAVGVGSLGTLRYAYSDRLPIMLGTGALVAQSTFPGWDEVFRGLADAKYQGALTLESFTAINPDLMAATKLWRPPRQPSEVLAGEGLKFMRAKAEQYGLM